jgi:hypothetical protein
LSGRQDPSGAVASLPTDYAPATLEPVTYERPDALPLNANFPLGVTTVTLWSQNDTCAFDVRSSASQHNKRCCGCTHPADGTQVTVLRVPAEPLHIVANFSAQSHVLHDTATLPTPPLEFVALSPLPHGLQLSSNHGVLYGMPQIAR